MNYIPIATVHGRLWSSLALPQLTQYVQRQIGNFFPDEFSVPTDVLTNASNEALGDVARSFKNIALPGYTMEGQEGVLSHMYGDQYTCFLVCLARRLSAAGHKDVATRVYLLNKALHGLDFFHEVALPEVFMFVHPVGTVVGRAQLGNFLCIYQNCTIGGSPREGHPVDYPTLGDYVLMYAKSSIIGRSKVGGGVVFAAGAASINQDIPPRSLVTPTKIIPEARNAPFLISRLFRGLSK